MKAPFTTNWNEPNISVCKKFYNFLNYVDPNKVQLILGLNQADFNHVTIDKEIVIVSTSAEAPRSRALVETANKHPSVIFICLADVEFYDFVFPKNVYVFKYRHWHIALEFYLDNYRSNLIPVKSKKISKKFSSLSFYNKQVRALVTACLLTYAKDQSIVSWHNKSIGQIHDYLIETLINNPRYQDLNWQLLEQTYLVDQYGRDQNEYQKNMNNNSNWIYQTSLINFSNETTNFGLYQVGDVYFIHPGPFLTEKTWNPLLAGNILFSTADPFVYSYLKNDYNIPIDYSIDMSFDTLAGDLDRFSAICQEIVRLSKIPLQDLIDQNIDNCELIQNTITNPDYLTQFEKFNNVQSEKILGTINQLTG